MRYIKTFDVYKIQLGDERVDEGLREWIIMGAISLASMGAKSQTSNQNQNQTRYEYSIKSNDSIKLNFDKEFKSGVFKPEQKNADTIKQKLSDIVKFIKNNPKKDILITIDACESQVPNVDIETGSRLSKGELANRRADNAKSLVADFMDSLSKKGEFQGKYKIDTTKRVGTTPFKQGVDSKDDSKYTSEQTVSVKVTALPTVTTTNLFAAYSKVGERVFNTSNNKAVGDLWYKTRSTKSVSDAGNVDTGYEDAVLKTLQSETDDRGKVVASNVGKSDQKMYLIPSDWMNSHSNGTSLTGSQWDSIKTYLEVDPSTGKYINGDGAKEWLTSQLKAKGVVYNAPSHLY